jgi:hypothetical protein
LKQSETKDQTRKDVTIKGSNYNFSGGLDYKIVKISKDQIRNIIQSGKTVPFQRHYSLSSSPIQQKGTVSATNAADYGERFTATISLPLPLQ